MSESTDFDFDFALSYLPYPTYSVRALGAVGRTLRCVDLPQVGGVVGVGGVMRKLEVLHC